MTGVAVVTPDSDGNDRYFPERTLARWLAIQGQDHSVYAFRPAGVRPLRAAYRALINALDIDAVVLADGGTDILMRGDEAGLGTPEEDMASLAAVAGLAVPQKAVVSLGFGIDFYHGVCHAHVLENIAALQRAGAYLGGFSIQPGSPEADGYLDAVAYATKENPTLASMVNTQVASALSGDFGDVHYTERTRGTRAVRQSADVDVLRLRPRRSGASRALPGGARPDAYADGCRSGDRGVPRGSGSSAAAACDSALIAGWR